MTRVFRIVLALIGLIVAGFCMSYVAFGFGATALWMEALAPVPPGFDATASADTDSELRVLAVPLAAIGVAAVWLAAVFPRQSQIIPWLLLTVFVAGWARIVPILDGSIPSAYSLMLMAAEIVVPIILAVFYAVVRPRR